MMLPSTAPNGIPTGLGAVIDPTTGAFSYPSWCSWMPFGDYFSDCTPATAAQIAASAAGDLAGSAATPANQAAIAAGVNSTILNDCSGVNGATDQASCQGYVAAVNCPTLTATVGTGAVGQGLCSLDGALPGGLATWGAIAALAVAYFAFRK